MGTAKMDCISHSILGGEILGFVSDAYYFAGFCDLFLKLVIKNDEDMFGLSYPGMAVGMFITLLSCASSYYCHSKLNALHQEDDNETMQVIEHSTAATPLLPARSQSGVTHDIDQKNKLSLFVMLALAGNLLAESASVAAGPTFVTKLATHKNPLSDLILLAINIISFIAGILFGGIADTRTCYRALIKIKANEIASLRGVIAVTEGVPVIPPQNPQDQSSSTTVPTDDFSINVPS